MTQIFNGPTYPSPDSMFYVQYHSKGAGTWSSMSWAQTPEIDALIDKARGETDVAKQNAIYKELQHKLVDDQSDVYLLASYERQAMNKCLDGCRPAFRFRASATISASSTGPATRSSLGPCHSVALFSCSWTARFRRAHDHERHGVGAVPAKKKNAEIFGR